MSLFISHGAPSLALEDNSYTQFLRQLGQDMEEPKGIIIFTAHWESERLSISSIDDTYETIYDFGGFSRELRNLKYPAKGSTKIAATLQEMFEAKGISTQLDTRRGLDHGSWVVLHLLFPDANIPVVQVSVNPALALKQQYELGKAIQELEQQGLLIIGSGGTVHNLGTIKWGQQTPEPWAVDFDDWLVEKVENKELDALFAYESLAPQAKLAIPENEHFVPLFIAMGSGSGTKPELLYRGYELGTISHITFKF